MTAEQFVTTLDAAGYSPRPSGPGRWKSRCPHHDGDGLSLGITAGNTGNVLITCFAHQCPYDAVAKALGVDPGELFAEPRKAGRRVSAADRRAMEVELARVRAERDAERVARKDGQRKAWPEMTVPTSRDVEAIAALRGLDPMAVQMASDRGLLRRCRYAGEECWIITDASRRLAQARRMDGKPWINDSRDERKAWTFPGSIGNHLIGLDEANGFYRSTERFPIIMLVEGGPDLLAAFHFILLAQREEDVTAVALLGAGMNPRGSDIARGVAGRRVVIVQQADAAGADAAGRWKFSLAQAGAQTEIADLTGLSMLTGAPINDLNDCATAATENHSVNQFIINNL